MRLLLAHHASLNTTSEKGETALWHAVIQGHTIVARMLLEAGADVESSLGLHFA